MSRLINKLAVIMLCGFFSLTALAQKERSPEAIAGTTRITAEKLIELVDEHDNLVIIDSRKTSDHAKGYIEGSIALANTDTSPETLAKYIASKDTPVVFYCNGVYCGRSGEAATIAVKNGYTNIYWFRGGWDEWTEKGYPVTQ